MELVSVITVGMDNDILRFFPYPRSREQLILPGLPVLLQCVVENVLEISLTPINVSKDLD